MSKRFLATVLAASIALTSFAAAPARADSGEVGRFLLGAGTLFIIGSALSNSDRNRGRTTVTTTRRRHVEPVYRNGHRNGRHVHRHDYRHQNDRHGHTPRYRHR